MKKESKKSLFIASFTFIAFLIWTLLISLIDLKEIGPEGSVVGFATINEWFHNFTGVHLFLYDSTDFLSLIPLFLIAFFGCLGLVQWIQRKSLFKVDYSIFVLGGFYIATLAAFVFFEIFPVNFRPILIEGVLEASYPSSTTMLCMCVFPTAILQFNSRIQNKPLRTATVLVLALLTFLMVAARLISGVHWLTDIIGGALLSTALVYGYQFFISLEKKPAAN